MSRKGPRICARAGCTLCRRVQTAARVQVTGNSSGMSLQESFAHVWTRLGVAAAVDSSCWWPWSALEAPWATRGWQLRSQSFHEEGPKSSLPVERTASRRPQKKRKKKRLARRTGEETNENSIQSQSPLALHGVLTDSIAQPDARACALNLVCIKLYWFPAQITCSYVELHQ